MNWGAMIGGAVDIWKDWRSDSLNRDIANAQFAQNIYQQNTAHQREVADLLAAGLNPILSASKGGPGAPTGGGVAPVTHGFRTSVLDSINSAIANERVRADIDLVREQVIQTAVGSEVKESEVLLNHTLAAKAVADAHTAFSSKAKLQSEKSLVDLEAIGQVVKNKILADERKGTKIEGEIDSTLYGQYVRRLKRGREANPIGGFGFYR